MKKLLLSIAVVGVVYVGYALFWPSDFQPQAWNTPTTALQTPSPIRKPLEDAERLAPGVAYGPEDIAVDSRGRLYAGYADGTIRRFDPQGGGGEVFATTNGRPLGLAFTRGPVTPPPADTGRSDAPAPSREARLTSEDEVLIVADAVRGLLAIAPDSHIKVLADAAEDTPFGLTDDVDVADDGRIYFSDASSKYDLHEYRTDIMEHGGHGRLMQYDPATGDVNVLLRGLQFANGVAVGPDDDFVLVTETSNYRVLAYQLRGEQAGQTRVFADNLPGFPDGISYDDEANSFWVALFAPRKKLLDFASDKPWLRRIIHPLPTFVLPQAAHVGRVLGIDTNGRIHTYLDDRRDAAFAPITSVEATADSLYLGSLQSDAFARIGRPDTP